MTLLIKGNYLSNLTEEKESQLWILPFSLEDIKNGKVTNVDYIDNVNNPQLSRVRVRLKWVDEKEKQIYFNLSEYSHNWILNETKLITDINKKKSELIELRKSITKLKTKEILDESWKILWVRIEKNNWNLLFSLELSHEWTKKKTWVRINPQNFSESFEKMMNKYKEVWKAVWHKEMNFMQSFNLYCSKEYYESIYNTKLEELAFENEKEAFILEWLISESGRIHAISFKHRSFILKDGSGKKSLKRDIHRHGEDGAFEQILTQFCFNHGIEFRWKMWNWLYNQRKILRKEYMK